MAGVALNVKDKKSLQAALVTLQNTLNEVQRFKRIRHVDTSEIEAQIQRDIETTTDLLREYGTPGPLKS